MRCTFYTDDSITKFVSSSYLHIVRYDMPTRLNCLFGDIFLCNITIKFQISFRYFCFCNLFEFKQINMDITIKLIGPVGMALVI